MPLSKQPQPNQPSRSVMMMKKRPRVWGSYCLWLLLFVSWFGSQFRLHHYQMFLLERRPFDGHDQQQRNHLDHPQNHIAPPESKRQRHQPQQQQQPQSQSNNQATAGFNHHILSANHSHSSHNNNISLFLPHDTIRLPIYSGAWWQSARRFVTQTKIARMDKLEGGSFAAYQQTPHQVRMTRDFLALGVEHLSKWWKIVLSVVMTTSVSKSTSNGHVTQLLRQRGQVVYNVLLKRLLKYIHGQLTTIAATTRIPKGDAKTRASATDDDSANAMPQTIALVVFSPWSILPDHDHDYNNRNNKNDIAIQNRVFSAVILAATVTSLVRVHCGRVLVVTDTTYADETQRIWTGMMEYLSTLTPHGREQEHGQPEHLFLHPQDLEQLFAQQEQDDNAQNKYPMGKTILLHQTQVSWMAVNCTGRGMFNKFEPGSRLIVKGGLTDLKRALLGKKMDLATRQAWLGPKSSLSIQKAGGEEEQQQRQEEPSSTLSRVASWDYVYMTEADTLLHVKQQHAVALRQALDDGKILIPHRFQPIPHQSDFAAQDAASDKATAATNELPMVPSAGKLSHVTELLVQKDVCCDQGPHHPGVDDFAHCGVFWFMCGFAGASKPQRQQNSNNNQHHIGKNNMAHERLVPYGLMRFQDGTGLTSLAGSHQGRACRPGRLDHEQNSLQGMCPATTVPP